MRQRNITSGNNEHLIKFQNSVLLLFSVTHAIMVELFNEMIPKPKTAPECFSHSIKYLLSKTNDREKQKNYRPIACLSTFYKFLTSILTERIYSNLEEHSICPIEKKKVVIVVLMPAKITCL